MHNFHIYALFVILFFTVNCQSKISETINQIVKAQDIPADLIKTQVVAYTKADSLSTIEDSIVSHLYAKHNYHSYWSDSASRVQLLVWFDSLYFDGLQPKHYDVDSLKILNQKWETLNDTIRAYWEVNATYNIVKAGVDEWYGETNPREIFPDWAYHETILPIPLSMSDWHHLLNKDIWGLLPKIRPTHPMYAQLRFNLIKLYQWDSNKDFTWEQIETKKKKLKLGDVDTSIHRIKKRLLNVGFLAVDNIDDTFDLALQNSVKTFQKHVSYYPTGVIDAMTLKRINFSKEGLYRTIIVNMERCRWLLKGKLPDEYILVNIADYTLTYLNKDSIVHQTNVVVGKEQHETPLFTSKLSVVELNPYWTVPVSIATKEVLPGLKRDSNYLAKHHMELFRGNEAVYVSDFSAYKETYFPFTIRQKPGPNNDLGVVKFVFPNPYSIYFHDTPSKWIFSLDQRNFSHGCIRLYKPLDFAEVILKKEGFTRQRIDEIVATEQNHPVVLKQKIPVLIVYWTCRMVDDDMHFMYDIYGRDQKIMHALQTP
ncbi:MAG: L,D-transpeptidase family protein [Cytophagaceae bacterium]